MAELVLRCLDTQRLFRISTRLGSQIAVLEQIRVDPCFLADFFQPRCYGAWHHRTTILIHDQVSSHDLVSRPSGADAIQQALQLSSHGDA